MTEHPGDTRTPETRTPEETRVLVLAPSRRDGDISASVLEKAGIGTVVCATLAEVCDKLQHGAGAALLAEELLPPAAAEPLVALLAQQPPWSDPPIIVLTRGGVESPWARRFFETLGNVVLLERPVRVATLVSAVRTALRGRMKQYQIRDYLLARRAAQEELERAREEAVSANQAKDQFLAVLSHELRTPLTPVVATLAMLVEDPSLPPDVREDLEMVRRNVELEARLIDDMLDLTRVARGKLPLQLQVCDLHKVLRQACEVCASQLGAKHLHVHFDLCAKAHHVRADIVRLQQVFWNFLSNAAKFTPEGGRVTLSTHDAGEGRVRVAVSDSGIGIESDQLSRLFRAFEQGDRAITRKFGGLGLGLSIAKALVEAHGGSIHAASDGPGRGTTMTVELPTVPAPEPGEITHRARGAARAETHLRILLVEDHADTRRILTRLLTQLGHEVTPTGSVGEALIKGASDSFQLVISDIGLPDGTGMEFLRQYRRACNHDVPAIALTGFGMEEDHQRSADAGFIAHLTKPVDLLRLRTLVDKVARES